MKMELIEGSETSAIRTQTPGNYPKENILHIEHGESLKSRIIEETDIKFCSLIPFEKRNLLCYINVKQISCKRDSVQLGLMFVSKFNDTLSSICVGWCQTAL